MAGNEFDIKIGYNKRAAATQNLQIILQDIEGTPLVDASNAPLIAEIEGFVTSELTSDKAVSVILPTAPRIISNFFSFIFAEEFEVANKVVEIDGTIVSDAFIRLINPEKTWQFLVNGFIIDAPTGNEIIENNIRTGYKFEQFKIKQIVQEPEQPDGKFRVRLDVEQDPTNLNTINYIRRVITKERIGTLKVEEQFAATSEVSRSLLGIDREETQLGLFSNVSTYGFDDDRFVFFPDNPDNGPRVWEQRQTESGINHYPARVEEVKNEGALRLTAYPVPYNFPYAPLTQNIINGSDVGGLFNEDSWKKWQNFLKLGKTLYELFESKIPQSTNEDKETYRNFLSRFIRAINIWDDENYYSNSNYGGSLDNYYRQISIWTSTFEQIKDGTLKDPVTAQVIDFTFLKETAPNLRGTGTDDFLDASVSNEGSGSVPNQGEVETNPGGLNRVFNPFRERWVNSTWSFSALTASPTDQGDFQPGYGPTGNHYVLLQSRQAFRYQPGRISGYTYGTRASLEKNQGDNTAEWGIFNDFDEYVFQREGANFFIVRRSVVHYPVSLLQELGVADEDGNELPQFVRTYTKTISGTDYIVQEVKIRRENFNGDSLNGNGPSGYLLTTDEITMYKIEFGWYGAIGLRLYAYIPIENGQARWVVVHTFVIENKLIEPSMGDPFFRFKYQLNIGSGQGPDITRPQSLYKYGTSMYIDGGDEGTVSVFSETSDVKTLPTSGEFNSIFGIYPKKNIVSGGKDSSGRGVSIPNKKIIIPKQISITSTGFAEISLVNCKGCIGNNFLYMPNLTSQDNGDLRRIQKLPPGQPSNEITLAEITITTSNSSTTSTSIETTDPDIKYLRPGDYLLENTNASITETRIESITENAGTYTITFTDAQTIASGFDLVFQPTFIVSDDTRRRYNLEYSDFESKIIKEEGNVRIFGTYLNNNISGARNETIGLIQRIVGQKFGIETERELDPDRIVSDFTTTPFTPGDIFGPTTESFEVRLSQFKAVASSVKPVNGPISKINWLNPIPRDNGSVAEYELGFTPNVPILGANNQIIGWRDRDGNTLQEDRNGNITNRTILKKSEYISVAFYQYAISYSTRYGTESGESWRSQILPLTQDFRVNNPSGNSSGRCSEALLEQNPPTIKQVTQTSVTDLNTIPLADWVEFSDQQQNELTAYLALSSTFLKIEGNTIIEGSLDPTGGQVAVIKNNNPITNFYDNSGNLSKCRFLGPERSYEEVVNGALVTFKVIPISVDIESSFINPPPNQEAVVPVSGSAFQIGYTSIVIRGWYSQGDRFDSPNSYTATDNGTGIFDYNAYPLYPIAFLRDRSQIRGAEITDIDFVGDRSAFNPEWKVNYIDDAPSINYAIDSNLRTGQINVDGIGSRIENPPIIDNLAPAAFTQVTRLSSTQLDKTGNSVLRPGNTLTTLYINNETKTFDLSDVFGSDRKVITPDITNTEATFLVARSINESTPIDIQVNITYVEQL